MPWFERCEAWHCARFVKPWLGPLPVTRKIVLVGLVLSMAAAFANVKVRLDQERIWKANPEVTEFAGTMSFSTADAPYFLGHAKLAKLDVPPERFNQDRNYPDQRTFNSESEKRADIFSRPLLSTLIAHWSKTGTNSDLLSTANKILIVNSALTAALIIFCFSATGYFIEGSVAAVGGGLSAAYLVRSSFGRIDTDQLNLGLTYAMFGLAVFASRTVSLRGRMVWAATLAVAANVFLVWYPKPELVWLVSAAFVWLLVTGTGTITKKILPLFIYLALAPLNYTNPFRDEYFQPSIKSENLYFPNALSTITEFQTQPKFLNPWLTYLFEYLLLKISSVKTYYVKTNFT